MGKQKKKRNKVYKGSEAATSQPSITRVTAVKRNKAQQWWFEHKRIVKPVSIASGVGLIVIWLLYELLNAIF